MQNRITLFPGLQNSENPLRAVDQDIHPQIRYNPPVRLQILEKDPWIHYKGFMKVLQAGPAILVYDKNRQRKIFAVKELRGFDKDSLKHLRPVIHPNLVRFVVGYYFKNSCFLFYDPIEVSLSDVLSSPKGNLEVHDMATICRGIIDGLVHLHSDLRICYGEVTSQNVLLSESGEVKLGMIFESRMRLHTYIF